MISSTLHKLKMIDPTWLLGAVPVIALVGYLFSPSGPPPIFGVYNQPNNWFRVKFCLAYLMLTLRKAVDGVYFVAANKDGYYFVAATARRPERVIDGFWFVRIPGVGLLKAANLPDGTRQAGDEEYSTTDGMLIQLKAPMKEWQIIFDGPMKFEGRESDPVNVRMEMTWTSNLPHFDFDTDIPPRALARAIAREPWTTKFFKSLEETHQTHYEQMGHMSSIIRVEGLGDFEFEMTSMRDHTYATKRDWTRMHRYGLHSVYVEDGTKFCVGIISQDDITRFEMGYLYTPSGKLYGVDECDLLLHCHGEGGTPPVDYSFTFRAGGQEYRVECKVLESPELFLGADWEARVVERMCTYKVNGKEGWGFAEWEYRNHGGRPKTVQTDDVEPQTPVESDANGTIN